jgi:hypothetical protein
LYPKVPIVVMERSQFFRIPRLALKFTGTESDDFALRGKPLHVTGSRDTPCRETKWSYSHVAVFSLGRILLSPPLNSYGWVL